jgi:deazaflavin-dependent oxidoreductase (nitroreductase family)
MALADFKTALNSASEIEITTIGRTSGREISNPVWFVEQGDKLYLLPVDGSESQWYENLLKNPAIRLAADEAQYNAKATPVTDPARVGEVVAAFRGKYGAGDVEKYYPKPDVAVEAPLRS